MAKSLRSKWRRKMKAEKRVRYGEKELNRLKEMLTKAGDYQMVPESESQQPTEPIDEGKILMTSMPKPQRKKFRDRRGEQRSSRRSRLDEFNEDEDEDGEDVEMKETEAGEAMSVDKAQRVFSKRTMKDQFGNYPDWMNKRKIMTQKKKNKRIAKNRAISLAGGKRNIRKRR